MLSKKRSIARHLFLLLSAHGNKVFLSKNTKDGGNINFLGLYGSQYNMDIGVAGTTGVAASTDYQKAIMAFEKINTTQTTATLYVDGI